MDLVRTYSDIETFRKATGASSVMLARAAMWNASVFSSNGPLLLEKVMEDYLKYVSLHYSRSLKQNITVCFRIYNKVCDEWFKAL